MPPFLLPDAPLPDLRAYRDAGGGAGLDAARKLGPAATVDEVRASGLRGRGGGGFPTGAKWQGVVSARGDQKYVVCNAAEGEPGTFKDRTLIRRNPYQLIEGVAITALAIGAQEAFICLKASFTAELDRLTRALAEMHEEGLAGDVPIRLVPGPEEYLFGEEKAMLEVIEGKDPLPRLFPPYIQGLFSSAPQMGWTSAERRGRQETNPTVANNAETLSNVPHILVHGADWFRTMGTPASPGTIVCTVVGDVVDPSVVEVDLGTSLETLIEYGAGGALPGRVLKAAFSGVANPVIPFDQFATPLTYEDLLAIGSGLGAAGFIVFDDSACMVEVARLFSRFLYVESCGQCPPCKQGSGEITAALERIEAGGGTDADVELMGSWFRKVTDGARCYLATEEREVISSILRTFPEEFAEHLDVGRCPRPRDLPLPKIVDLEAGRVVYDERQYRKQPDWSYAEAPSPTT
jgi:NADH-quinone oxidoreductase subunit F